MHPELQAALQVAFRAMRDFDSICSRDASPAALALWEANARWMQAASDAYWDAAEAAERALARTLGRRHPHRTIHQH